MFHSISHRISSRISRKILPARISRKIFSQEFACKIFPQEFPARFSHKNFPPDFPTRFSCKNFLQDFPARFSHKIFLQDFPARISHKNFLQDFLARFSCKNFPQDFPKLDPDWLAPDHPIPNAKFPPITAFLKLAFPLLLVPQEFPARISHKIFPQDFPELDPDWLAPHHPIPNAKFPPITAFLKLAYSPPPLSRKNFPQDFPARISRKIFPQEFPARFSHKIFLSWILIGWLPITLFQMLNFHQSLPFLNWLIPLLLVPQEFPTRFSRKNFPQDFPTRISCKIFPQDFPELDPDWLAPHHPIPNAKFPPITVLLNRPTYHKRSKMSPPPFLQILWEPQIYE